MVLAIVIIIVALLGNLYLFSGYDVQGDVAEFMVAVAMLADLFVIFVILFLIHGSIQAKKQARENQRISAITQKINDIINSNSPLKPISLHNGQQICVLEKYVAHEWCLKIKHFKDGYDALIRKCAETNGDIMKILSCHNCSSADQKLAYLEVNLEELKKLKSKSDKLTAQIDSLKFSIPFNDGIQTQFYQAFSLLLNSKKCACDVGDIRFIVADTLPIDIALFDLKKPLVSLKVDENYYCLTGEVIVAFDKNGYFSTILDKSALKIDVKKQTSELYLIDDKNYSNQQYIDSDSKLILRGRTSKTWLHTCIDGTPDLRYNYNPRVDKRIDVYEYGIITIRIATYNLKITTSSQKALEAFGELKEMMKYL